ncbi:hypothetical protein KL933_003325 [Ogataea haglerorum]|uniref:Non-structural maintenance of chromosomes element 1 homolog n=1 Tax=Ogataea haglerorum TaxID=1937702 RepID=A0AAN6D3X4_9ASCO|nr:uncharacterized protein KL911_003800 [Ogataea haglerorum]KAG7695076.1 hypothetical protein KL915_003309 [Ogataea haglerorum]KAG7706400.1 hypothetical protein KL914_003295 [Ogataea haglerorum]KAG7707886.1 hypothetical protein KL950_002512 [Ogataea haglerorum]KAG7717316.1 hypothetical protein KL913_003067 [Ogataea haglerorum]KAG7719296.1 hypothetical protein KL949_002288 [Ogataea haglerorum]
MESLVTHILEEYGDLHRSLLQFLMAVKSVEFEVLHTIFVKLVIQCLLEKNHPEPSNSDQERYLRELLEQTRPELPTLTSESLVKTLALINRELAALDLEIVETLAQDNEKNINVSFVNTKSSPSIKLSTSYTEKEISVINQLIDQMFESPLDDEDNLTYSLSYTQALNVAKRNIQTITDAQKFINKLESSGWLETAKGKYTLSARALAELKSYLIAKFEIKSAENPDGAVSWCHGCNEIITMGYRYLPR